MICTKTHEELSVICAIKKCSNNENGIHSGVKHKDFGDGCCTCGAYILFNNYQSCTDIDQLKKEYPDEFKIMMDVLTRNLK